MKTLEPDGVKYSIILPVAALKHKAVGKREVGRQRRKWVSEHVN